MSLALGASMDTQATPPPGRRGGRDKGTPTLSQSGHHLIPGAPSVPRGEAWDAATHGTARWIDRLPQLVLAGLIGVAIVNLLLGVFLRYIMIEITDYFDWPTVSFFWVEEVGEFTLAWLTLVGAAIGIRERAHFTLDLLVHHLPARARRIIAAFNAVLIAAFGALVAYTGWGLSLLNSELESPGLSINLAWLYASALVGGTLILVYGLALAVADWRAAAPAGHPEA